MKNSDMYHLFVETRSGIVKNAVSAAIVIAGPSQGIAARAAGCFWNKSEKEAAAAMFELGCVLAGNAGFRKLMVHADETDGHDPFGIESVKTAFRPDDGGVDCFGTGSYQYLPGGPDPEGDNYWWEGAFDEAGAMAEAVRPPYALNGSGDKNDAAVIATDSDGNTGTMSHAAVVLAGEDGGKKAFLALSTHAGYKTFPRIAAVQRGVDAAMILSRAYGSESIALETSLGSCLDAKRYAGYIRQREAEHACLHDAELHARPSVRQPEREWEQAVQEALFDVTDVLSDGRMNSKD